MPLLEPVDDLTELAGVSSNAVESNFNVYEDKLNDLNQQMATAKAELGKPFPQEEELRSKSARLAELDAKLNLDRPAAQAEKKTPEQER